MKFLWLLTTIGFFSISNANAISLLPEVPKVITPLLKCLGKEELGFHLKKDTGPNYKLNQHFINSMAGANDIQLRSGYYKKICENSVTPSVNLLRELLLNGLKIFLITEDEENFREQARKLTVLGNVEEDLPHLFFKYLASLQALTDDPHCLKKAIPEVSYFTEKVFFLEEDVPRNRLLNEKGKIRILFNKLGSIGTILKKCKKK